LDAGLVGGLAFFVVCGLLGAALGLVGLHIFLIVEELAHGDLGSRGNGEILAYSLTSMLWEAGSLLALAAVVYLLAPRAGRAREPTVGPIA
jgi:hypothetical protein